jgi:hypothetical protein
LNLLRAAALACLWLAGAAGALGAAAGPGDKGKPAAPLRPSRMEWQEYVLPGRGALWPPEAEKVLKGQHAKVSPDRRSLTLTGACPLGTLPGPGRMLRFGLSPSAPCRVELWSGNEGVAIDLQPSKARMKGQTLTRKGPGAQAVVTHTVEDGGGWRWYRLGAVDLRHQDGELLVCRGEIPLLRLPLARPPTEGRCIGKKTTFWLAEARACRPLAPPPGRVDAGPVADRQANSFKWQTPPDDKATLEKGLDGGAVALSAKEDKDAGQAWFDVDVPGSTGVEVTVHVSACTALAGVFVRTETSGDIRYRAEERDGKTVFGRGEKAQVADDVRRGWTIGPSFRFRVRCGLGFLMTWVSPDGKRWWPRQVRPFKGAAKQLCIGLETHAGKGPRRIAVDRVQVRRFTAIRGLADPALLAKTASALTDAVLDAPNRAQALAALEKARGKDADAAAWRRACDVALAGCSRAWETRRAALREALLDAVDGHGQEGDPVVPAAVREVREITGPEQPGLPQLLHDVLDALGRQRLGGGRDTRRALQALVDAAYPRPGAIGMPTAKSEHAVAPGLLRLHLLDLAGRGRWPALRREALRCLYLSGGRLPTRTGSRRSPGCTRRAWRRTAPRRTSSGNSWSSCTTSGTRPPPRRS